MELSQSSLYSHFYMCGALIHALEKPKMQGVLVISEMIGVCDCLQSSRGCPFAGLLPLPAARPRIVSADPGEKKSIVVAKFLICGFKAHHMLGLGSGATAGGCCTSARR